MWIPGVRRNSLKIGNYSGTCGRLNNMKNMAITVGGEEESAKANRLHQRQAEAEAAVRKSYRDRLDAARGLRRLALWCRMRGEIRRARKKVEDRLAPRQGLYFQQE